ncbi:L-galactono-1,4-lactone dehydrogenase 2, mitochondrial [Zea mays]|uniref:L-galactono-1,4-lactone dehydrogenase 2, mitochondrial n=1 Tax=Zea mays TaxID=4577 RepID=A0A3L6F4V0_MAIZE|nr:L-galactono-1,4-lactone dehydrogenase 2, mitochondrial [Zea mays]
MEGARSTSAAAAAPGRRSTSAIRSLFSRQLAAAGRAPSGSSVAALPDLHRCKSFSCERGGDALAAAGKPQRRSCDVRGRSTLWALFHQDDRQPVRDGTEFGAFPASSSAAAAALAAKMLFRTKTESKDPEIDTLSFTELRDKLLALDPLAIDHVVKINKAEAEYWKKSEGYHMGWSDEILGFDCGGQQWVSENCFPTETLAKPSMKDLEYIDKLLQLIEKEEIPAPGPIEQRWTARSKSPMSPGSSSEEDDVFSWFAMV